MLKRMSLDDVQFRQVMVGDNTAEFEDREDQHRQIQDRDQTNSAALSPTIICLN